MDTEELSLRKIYRLWLPLAGSWFLMGVETPALTAFVARMTNPELNLAAWGSLVFPISLVIEGPIIMLLAASTALAVDQVAYKKLLNYMWILSGLLTLVHIAIAFTPLYDWLANSILSVPKELHEPGRLGLKIMTPWTVAIAWRRLNQGVLIRTGASRAVAIGTGVRLGVLLIALAIGRSQNLGSGIIVGASAVAIAVSAEALFAWWMVKVPVSERLPKHSNSHAPLNFGRFLTFYIPLALTPLLTLVIQPAGAAAMSRMPNALDSLAAWPAVHGLVFLTRGVGFAFNEVVVALADDKNGIQQLRRFARRLAAVTVGVLALLGLTPLGKFWFGSISGLSEQLTTLSSSAIVLAIAMPGYQVYQSLYQGILVHKHATRAVSEAVAIYVVLALLGLLIGANYSTIPGIQWAVCSFVVAGLSQTLWLRRRANQLGC